MLTESLIKELENLIYDVSQIVDEDIDSKQDIRRVFANVEEGEEGTLKSYDTLADGLSDAAHALDTTGDKLKSLEDALQGLVEDLKYHEVSHKVWEK